MCIARAQYSNISPERDDDAAYFYAHACKGKGVTEERESAELLTELLPVEELR